jgi:hypothetical protein
MATPRPSSSSSSPSPNTNTAKAFVPRNAVVQWVVDRAALARVESHKANLEKMLERVRDDRAKDVAADSYALEEARARKELGLTPAPLASSGILAARRVRRRQLDTAEQRCMQLVSSVDAQLEALRLAPLLRTHTNVVVATPDMAHTLDKFAESLKSVSEQQSAQSVKIDGAFTKARSAEDQSDYDYEKQLEEAEQLVELTQQLNVTPPSVQPTPRQQHVAPLSR